MKNQVFRSVFDVRSVYSVFKRSLSQAESGNFFKFYSEDEGKLCDKYKPLEESDYERFLSKRAKKREPAITRLVTSLAYKVDKEMISLAEGMPNEEVFPFSKLRMEMKSGGGWELTGQDLAKALQYVPSQGLPALIDSLRQLQADLHRPPKLPRDIIVTNGAQHGIYQCIELLVDEGDPVIVTEFAYTGAHVAVSDDEGDPVIVTEFAYTGAHVALKPYDPEILAIPEDEYGMVASHLEAVLHERLAKGLKMPKMLYLIPTGNNPSGAVLSEGRRREIYEIACKYDFLIVEDDPYMFLNYDEKPVPTFLSLDTCGRVLRLDSLSKVVSAGLRAGWVTAPAPLRDRLELHTQAELLHSCTVSQAILLRLLSDRAALARHLQGARAFYRRRRDALHAALTHARVHGVARWSRPDAGLFLWLKVMGVDDVYDMVFKTAFERGLMLVPGQAFQYDSSATCAHVRLTFSKVPLEHMETAARHLVEVIESEQQRTLDKRQQRFATER